MELTLKELAENLGARFYGNSELIVKGVRRYPETKENHITSVYHRNPEIPKKFLASISSIDGTKEKIAIYSNCVRDGFNCIVVEEKDTVAKFKELLNIYSIKENFNPGIHPTAVIGENVSIGEEVSIGAHSVIGERTIIGFGTVIYPNVTIYPGVIIGDNCIIHSGTVIRGGVEIGNTVEIDCNASIGCNTSEVRVRKISEDKVSTVPTTGKIVICDKVHVGAHSVFIRGLADETVIGEGTFIDSHVHINYGVKTDQEVKVYAQSALNDYVVLGEKVIVCARTAINTRVKVGKRGYIVGGSYVKNNVKEFEKIAGAIPAKSKKEWFRLWGNITRLPWVRDNVKNFRKQLKEK